MNSFFGIPMMIPSRQLSDCDKGGWQTTQNVACVLPQVQYRTKGSVFPGQYVRYSEETTQKVNYPDFFRRWRQRSRFILIPFLIQQLRVMACNISQVGQVQPLLKLSDSTVHSVGHLIFVQFSCQFRSSASCVCHTIITPLCWDKLLH